MRDERHRGPRSSGATGAAELETLVTELLANGRSTLVSRNPRVLVSATLVDEIGKKLDLALPNGAPLLDDVTLRLAPGEDKAAFLERARAALLELRAKEPA